MKKFLANVLNTKRTRFKITVIAGIFLMVVTLLGIIRNMEGLSSACVGGILTILSTYIYGETKRPSDGYCDEYYEKPVRKYSKRSPKPE